MEYHCISADCHIDLNWLPHDLFVSSATAAMKERMPYVAEKPDGLNWVTKSGIDLGYAYGKGSKGPIGATGGKKTGRDHRVQRMASTGLYSDGAEGIRRPTTPELRLRDQDRDGIQAEVMYGLLGAGNRMTDKEALGEFYRIYNDWLVDFCGYNRERFVGLASIPSHDVHVAAAEVRRVAKLGLGGLDVGASWDMTPLWSSYWDPLWAAAEEVDLPVHFHTISIPPQPIPEDTPLQFQLAHQAAKISSFQINLATILTSMIFGGAMERHPKLRMVLGESGIGWIPYVLDRMDYEYEDRYKGQLPLSLKPSEYWYRQCRATFQNDRIGAKLLDDLGHDNVMWGSDYPHSDGVFPDSQHYIKQQFGDLPNDLRRKIICENTGKFYKLIP